MASLLSTPLLSTDLLTYYRQMSQQPLTVIDVETTGHKAHSSRVIEISVLQASLEDGIQHQQTHLVNPEILVPERITQFTGISQQMVDAAPLAAEVWPLYLPLLQSGILTAHNLAFDYSFLRSEYQLLGIAFSRPETEQFCTVKLARLMLADLPSRSLPHLVQHFQFPVDTSHRAAADTLACWLLAEKLLRQIQFEEDAVLLQQFQQEWLPLRLAAQIMGISRNRTKRCLERAGAVERLSQIGSPLYRRGDVEQVLDRMQQ